jgi:hypothetical protein
MTYILVVSITLAMFWLGRKSGYHNGYIAGRKAVRKQYEQVGR